MTTASHALEFATGDIIPRPGFGERLTDWIKARRNSSGPNPHSVTELEPHAVLGRMMWTGVR
jgi:hypothetical protein